MVTPAVAQPPEPELVSASMPEAEAQETGTVGEYLDQWLAHVRGRVRARTWQGYEGVIRLYALPRLSSLELVSLRPLDLQHLYSGLLAREVRPLSAGTVLNLHLVLHQALGQAVRWDLIASNPVDGAQPPRPRRPEFTAVDTALPDFLRPYLVAQRERQVRRIAEPPPPGASSGAVVEASDGSPMHPDALTNSWRRYVAKAGCRTCASTISVTRTRR